MCSDWYKEFCQGCQGERPSTPSAQDSAQQDSLHEISASEPALEKRIRKQLQALSQDELIGVNLTLAANQLYTAGPSDPTHLNNISGAARLLRVGILAIANQGPLATTLLNSLILDVLAQRPDDDELVEPEPAVQAPSVVPAVAPVAPVPAKASRKRKQPVASADGVGPLNGTLPAAQGDTGVPILATLQMAAGGFPAGVHAAGVGVTGAVPAVPLPIVSSSFQASFPFISFSNGKDFVGCL